MKKARQKGKTAFFSKPGHDKLFIDGEFVLAKVDIIYDFRRFCQSFVFDFFFVFICFVCVTGGRVQNKHRSNKF